MKYLMLFSLLILVNCGSSVDYKYIGCTINDNIISCPDGTKQLIPIPKDGKDGEKGDKGDNGIDGTNGQDGQDGQDGADGRDGIDGIIVGVVDPCGNYIYDNNPNHQYSVDEVILFLNDGSYLAWYQNIGFSVLQENIAYQTTDKQQCNFKIVNGQVIEL